MSRGTRRGSWLAMVAGLDAWLLVLVVILAPRACRGFFAVVSRHWVLGDFLSTSAISAASWLPLGNSFMRERIVQSLFLIARVNSVL